MIEYQYFDLVVITFKKSKSIIKPQSQINNKIKFKRDVRSLISFKFNERYCVICFAIMRIYLCIRTKVIFNLRIELDKQLFYINKVYVNLIDNFFMQ